MPQTMQTDEIYDEIEHIHLMLGAIQRKQLLTAEDLELAQELVSSGKLLFGMWEKSRSTVH